MGQKKESTEPNLHVCGEDGTQRVVYKLKEERAKKKEGRWEQKKKRERKPSKKKKNEKRKRAVLITKENDRRANFGPSIYVRMSLFIIQKLT